MFWEGTTIRRSNLDQPSEPKNRGKKHRVSAGRRHTFEPVPLVGESLRLLVFQRGDCSYRIVLPNTDKGPLEFVLSLESSLRV